MYFARTESLHFDPVVPSNFKEDRNVINVDSDSDASIVIIDEIPSTIMDTDILIDRSATGNERNAEEIPLHYELMDYFIDANEQKEEENPLSMLHLIQLYRMD